MSAHVRLGEDGDVKKAAQEAVEEAAALGAEGLDLAIVYLPKHDPAVLEPLADAIRSL